MDAKFWIQRWEEGQIGFHRENYNESLLKFFPLWNAEKDQRVLVPLCGKTKDMFWLYQQGLQVVGVELAEKAAEAFFEESGFTTYSKKSLDHFTDFAITNLLIRCGDFFKLEERDGFDFIYDRAALVALPEEMRKQYAEVVTKALKQNGKYLLIVYSYNQDEISGPPFSVSDKEVKELFGRNFSIRLLESERPQNEKARASQLNSFVQNIYLLQKN